LAQFAYGAFQSGLGADAIPDVTVVIDSALGTVLALVMDVTGSMGSSCSGCTGSKLNTAKIAAKNLLDTPFGGLPPRADCAIVMASPAYGGEEEWVFSTGYGTTAAAT
jgi:hypothetical protein